MIFIPKKECCLVWNETEDGIHIIYYIDGNNTREFGIKFLWSKSPKMNEKNEVYYEMDFDPFYISVIKCMNDEVLNCPLNACSAKPQLRYNKIINKWYCNCPSSALCTKNDDQDELDEMFSLTKEFTEKRGFCDSPIEAILKWNENCAKDYENIAKGNLKEYKNWKIRMK